MLLIFKQEKDALTVITSFSSSTPYSMSLRLLCGTEFKAGLSHRAAPCVSALPLLRLLVPNLNLILTEHARRADEGHANLFCEAKEMPW